MVGSLLSRGLLPSVPRYALCVALFATGCAVETVSPTDDDDFEGATSDLAVGGRWQPPGPVLAAGDAHHIRYDRATQCTGGMTPGAADLAAHLQAQFAPISNVGGYACRSIRGSRVLSLHASGRALDIMLPTVNGQADNTAGDPIANWLIEHAAEIGVQYIIWDRASWSGYRPAGQKFRYYGGVHPHHDHIHVELNDDGAGRNTPFFRPPPEPWRPAEPTECGLARGDRRQGVGSGRSMMSCDGRFRLIMQEDGNLVLYHDGVRSLWTTHSRSRGGYAAVMQEDGNFVLYDRWSRPLWNSNTAGNPGAFLALQNDGNLVVYTADKRPLWESGSGGM